MSFQFSACSGFLKSNILNMTRKSSLSYFVIMSFTHYQYGVPKGIRTPVTAVKGQCPGPLDDGDSVILLLVTSIRQSVWTLRGLYLSGKEVIQPQVPLRLPCYDFTPVMNHKVVSALPKVKLPTSFATHSHGVTGGVYKARERIHRGILIHDY